MDSLTELSPELATIARRYFGTTSLETQTSGDKDFKEVAVWNLKAALEAAFEAGRESGQQKAPGLGGAGLG